MKATFFAVLASGLLLLPAIGAEKATMHGKELRRDGDAIRMTNFDVTLDGRLLTAKQAIYHPDSGVVELTGNVKLHFGPKARSFPGEVK